MKNQSVESVSYILGGWMLASGGGLADNTAGLLAAIFGLCMIFVGYSKLETGLDETGRKAVGLLRIGLIIGLVAVVISLIPLMGWLAGIVLFVAAVIEFVAYLQLRGSKSVGETGKSGLLLLLIAVGFDGLELLFELIPLIGETIGSFVALVAIVLSFLGWLKIQEGLKGATVASLPVVAG